MQNKIGNPNYRPDNLPLNRNVLGPGEALIKEWQSSGLEIPNTDLIAKIRYKRVLQQLKQRNLDAIMIYDPTNLIYLTNSSNMSVWITHNASRYAVLFADGSLVLFDYKGCEHLSAHNPLITELKNIVPWFYFEAGLNVEKCVKRWSDDLLDTIKKYAGTTKIKLAVDKLNHEGIDILRENGVEIANGEEVMENARLIKSDEEIKAMKCAIHTVEKGVLKMHKAMKPGMTENELWSVMLQECFANDSEWVECRLLSSGTRTNPWLQESSSKIIKDSEVVSFDTDLIANYAMCADFSRAWLVGDGTPDDELTECFNMAKEQVIHNTQILQPNITINELQQQALQYDIDKYLNYGMLYHGIGICDEYPVIGYKGNERGYDMEITPGTVLCVESYVGRKGGNLGVKLEDQVLVTATGYEVLTNYPMRLKST